MSLKGDELEDWTDDELWDGLASFLEGYRYRTGGIAVAFCVLGMEIETSMAQANRMGKPHQDMLDALLDGVAVHMAAKGQ